MSAFLRFVWSLRPSRREAVAMVLMFAAIIVFPIGGMALHYGM